ncbi:MAG: P-type conjugative transfer protein TrbJ [Pseudomonadota bacterium]
MTVPPARRPLLAAAVLAVLLTPAVAPSPAAAGLFGGGGLGRIVYDPRNHAENLLLAVRALEQIDNQIASLQNETAMLLNQARNLTVLPYSALDRLEQSIARTEALLGEAQRLAYDVSDIEAAFAGAYRDGIAGASGAELLAGARSRWQDSVAGVEDALKTQAGIVGTLDQTRRTMADLVARSQDATGALQAAQAGNQLAALQTRQLTDLTALLAAQGRAEALDQARQVAAQEQAREQLRRFLEPGVGYIPTSVDMFGGR